MTVIIIVGTIIIGVVYLYVYQVVSKEINRQKKERREKRSNLRENDIQEQLTNLHVKVNHLEDAVKDLVILHYREKSKHWAYEPYFLSLQSITKEKEKTQINIQNILQSWRHSGRKTDRSKQYTGPDMLYEIDPSSRGLENVDY